MLERTEYSVKVPKITDDFDAIKTAINQPTGNFFYDPWEIKPEYKGSVWEKLLKSLPHPHGEARVIVMQPGTTYMAHADIDNRWHLSLQGEQSYLIDLDNQQLHLLEQDGYWYYMDAGRIHVASNYGSKPRIQLVVRELLTATTMPTLAQVTIKPASAQHDYRYKFDNLVSPWLNRANQRKSIKDFEFEGEIVKFKTAITELADLKLNKDFRIEVDTIP
jgi:hypothetical protein